MVTLYEKIAIIECNHCFEARENLKGLDSRTETAPRYLRLSHEARRRTLEMIRKAEDLPLADTIVGICLDCDYSKPCIANKLSPKNSGDGD
jgi:hypothetical protein